MATNELQEVSYFSKHYERVGWVRGGAKGRGYIYLMDKSASLGTYRKRGVRVKPDGLFVLRRCF